MSEIETAYFKKSIDGSFNPDGTAPDRASLFGDGIFETMVFQSGKILFKEHHHKRLVMGLRTLGISDHNISAFTKIEKLVNGWYKPGTDTLLRIRWNIYRAGLGKYTPPTHDASENIIVQAFHPAPLHKPKAYISHKLNLHPTPWSNCKTLNALTYVMANLEKRSRKMDEVILLDDKGFVSEAGSSNLFWQKGTTIYTPDLRHNAIQGVARSVILENAKSLSLNVEVGSYKPSVLFEAERLFTTNVTGISTISALEDKSYEIDGIKELNSLFPF